MFTFCQHFHEYVLTRTHICSFYRCTIEHTFEIFAKICYKNRTYVFLRTHYMSMYSYVVLKVHTNVQKVGTHLNVCFVYRTYVRWKYTFMFAYKKKRSIYLYIMNICLSVGTRTLSLPRPFLSFLLYYIYIQKRNTLSRIFFTFCPHLCLPLYSFIIYSIYREEHTFPPFSYPFSIVLLYSLLYIEWYILCPPPFYPL